MVKSNSEDYLISIVDNALKVLLALGSKEGKSIRELASELDITKSTLYRVLRTLELRDFVRQDVSTEKYFLGFQMFELGSRLKEEFDVRNISLPYMEKLRNITGETVQLAIVEKEDIIILETVDGIRELRIFSAAGTRLPITYGNFGKVFLSELPQSEALEFIKKYPLKKYALNSITDTDLYLKSLREVKEKGISIGLDDPIDGAYSMVVPIFNQQGKTAASISIAGAKTQESLGSLQQTELYIKETALQISKELGFKG